VTSHRARCAAGQKLGKRGGGGGNEEQEEEKKRRIFLEGSVCGMVVEVASMRTVGKEAGGEEEEQEEKRRNRRRKRSSRIVCGMKDMHVVAMVCVDFDERCWILLPCCACNGCARRC
jgi:hypothetical protein